MRASRTFGGLGTSLLLLSAHILFGGCEREVTQLDESFALCGVRSDELKDSTLVAPWNDSGFQPSDGRDTELHLIGVPSHSGASVVTPRGCLVVPKLRPFVLVHLRESGRGFVLESSALEGRPRLTRATLGPIADVPLARRCGLVETADASAWLSLTTREGRPLLFEDLTIETLDAAPGKGDKGDAKGTAQAGLNPKRVAPLGCVARSGFSATEPRLVTQKSTRLAAYLGLQEINTASLRVESALGADFFRSCRVNPDEDVRASVSQSLTGKVEANGRLQLLSVKGAIPADIVTANFSVCTSAGSSEGCTQPAWQEISRAAGTGLRRVGACILAPPGDERAHSSVRVATQDGRVFFAFLGKQPAQATSIVPFQVMEIPSAARFRETVRFEIGRCLADAAGRVRNVHEKQSFDARLAGGEVAGIAGSFVPSKLIWTAHSSNGTTRQIAFLLNEPFSALPFESIGFPFDTTSVSEWVDARLEVRFSSGETAVLEEAGGCRLSPWRASVAKVDVAERDLGVMARGSARTLEELGIDRTAAGLNDERIRYAYSFGPTAPDSGERSFADGASCLVDKGWKEVRDGVVPFLTSGFFGLSIRACNPAGGSAAPWTFRATVSNDVPDFELAWIDPLQLAAVPTIGSFSKPVPFEVRDLRDDALPWNDLAASASCQVAIMDDTPVNKTSPSCSLEPDRRLRVLKGHINFASQGFTVRDLKSWLRRRLRVTVSVGTDKIDKRMRFLEAEIPRYVLQGYAPVVDVIPFKIKSEICGTARSDNGTQYMVIADGSILRLTPGDARWGPFTTLDGTIVRAFTPSRESEGYCQPMDLVPGTNNDLFITPVYLDFDEKGLDTWDISAETPSPLVICSHISGCLPMFQNKPPEDTFLEIVRKDEVFAALSVNLSADKTHARLFVRNADQGEFEITVPYFGEDLTWEERELYFLSANFLVLKVGKITKIYNLYLKVWSDMPARLTEGGWQECRTWLSAGGSVCSHHGTIRVIVGDTVTEFKLSDIKSDGSEDHKIVAVRLEADAIFVALRVDFDLHIYRFDRLGRLEWKHRLFSSTDRWRPYRKPDRPVVFQIIDGRFVLLTYDCQGYSFDRDGRERVMVVPFGTAFFFNSGNDVTCAIPAVRNEELVFHSKSHGLLRAVRDPAVTWIEWPDELQQGVRAFYDEFSSKFRLLTKAAFWRVGRDDVVVIDAFDGRRVTFIVPKACYPDNHPAAFENLAICEVELDNIPGLAKEYKEFLHFGSHESLAQRVRRSHDGRTIFMNGKYVAIPEGEEIVFSAQNGILSRTQGGRLLFRRIGSKGETKQRDVSSLAPGWRNFVDSGLELEKAALGRTAIVCGKDSNFNECIAWSQDGILGDDGVVGSSFDADTAKLKLIRFVDVAGWEGINAAVSGEKGVSLGNFVFTDQGRLRFVERVAASGGTAHFHEILEGNLMAVGDSVLSLVSDGVWEVTPQKYPKKRIRRRMMSSIPNERATFDKTLTSNFQGAFEFTIGHYLIYVLPHFDYE